jgi:hypothetical protein
MFTVGAVLTLLMLDHGGGHTVVRPAHVHDKRMPTVDWLLWLCGCVVVLLVVLLV